MRKEWMRFENKGNKRVAIDIYDNIGGGLFFGGFTAKNLSKQLNEAGEVDDIDVTINSNGGEVFEGFAVYEILRNHSAKVNVKILGIAASIASIIAMAGDTIEIAENGFMMVHAPRAFDFGESKKLRKTADLLDKMEASLVNTYVNRTGGKEEEIRAMVAEETWLTAKEAVEKGFADSVSEKVKAVAFMGDRYEAFAALPQQLVAQTNPEVEAIETDEPEEKKEMTPDEIQAMINSAVAPLTTQVATLQTENETLRNQVAARQTATHAETITARVENLVASRRMMPQDRESTLLLLNSVTPEQANAYLAAAEKKAPIQATDRLTREITSPTGARQTVAVDKAFTIPAAEGTENLITPSNSALAMYSQIAENCESQEEFRRRAYAAVGESPSATIKQPWEDKAN